DHIGVALAIIVGDVELLPRQGSPPVHTTNPIATAIGADPRKLQPVAGGTRDIVTEGAVRVDRWQMVRQRHHMGIHLAHLVMVVFTQQWLEISPGVDSGIQAPEDILAAPWEDDLVAQGAFLAFPKG